MNKCNKQSRRKQSLQFSRQLSSYQWAIVKRMNLEQLIDLYRENPDIATYQEFFMNVKPATLEAILKIVFCDQKNKSPQSKAKALELIAMIKGGTSLVQYALQDHQFDKMLILGFLDQQIIPQTALSIFGDIFTGFSRTCPNKLMEVVKDQKVQYLFTRNMKKTEIHKIIYTLIFCLNKNISLQENEFICAVIYSLLAVVFENGHGVTIFEQQYWRTKSSINKEDTDKIRKCSEESKELSFSTNQNQQTQKQMLKSFLTQTHFEEFRVQIQDNYQVYFEQIIQISENIALMFEELAKNLPEIYKGNVQTLVDIIHEHHYIMKLFIFLNLLQTTLKRNNEQKNSQDKFKQMQQLYNQVVANIYKIIYNIMQLYSALQNCFNDDSKVCRKNKSSNGKFGDNQLKQSQKNKRGKNSITSLCKIIDRMSEYETEKTKSQVIEKLKIKVLRIIKQISQHLALQWTQKESIVCRSSSNRVSQLSGLEINKIQFSKYWTVKILSELYQIIEHSPQPNISSEIGINPINPIVIPMIIQIFESNKWNNIMHQQINKLFRLYLDNQYNQFVDQLQKAHTFSATFLGYLVSNFRNKNHVFLNSMNMCNQGDQHIIFMISKYITGKLSQKAHLRDVMIQFPIWKNFVHNDLKKYENVLNRQGIFSQEIYSQPQLSKHISMKEDTPIQQPIETIQQMIQSCQMNKRWSIGHSPSKIVAPRRRKQSFNSFQAIKQIDSLRNFELKTEND